MRRRRSCRAVQTDRAIFPKSWKAISRIGTAGDAPQHLRHTHHSCLTASATFESVCWRVPFWLLRQPRKQHGCCDSKRRRDAFHQRAKPHLPPPAPLCRTTIFGTFPGPSPVFVDADAEFAVWSFPPRRRPSGESGGGVATAQCNRHRRSPLRDSSTTPLQPCLFCSATGPDSEFTVLFDSLHLLISSLPCPLLVFCLKPL